MHGLYFQPSPTYGITWKFTRKAFPEYQFGEVLLLLCLREKFQNFNYLYYFHLLMKVRPCFLPEVILSEFNSALNSRVQNQFSLLLFNFLLVPYLQRTNNNFIIHHQLGFSQNYRPSPCPFLNQSAIGFFEVEEDLIFCPHSSFVLFFKWSLEMIGMGVTARWS